jgi:hypothetical protein
VLGSVTLLLQERVELEMYDFGPLKNSNRYSLAQQALSMLKYLLITSPKIN